ncbi:MAG TPA: efflux RND transporter permease subunit [Pirellulaceae bacterium]|nr:efflux RND transporter permease subunit [Pirellulaceae bacterium]HMO92126.1 efflux RND transporter permease subunit [Pirellulaceae bacterium]HMP69286.1 efflux RND transporter permease subunit [Pirellulaceae bacterium]
MKISELSIRRPVTSIMVVSAMIVFGVVAYFRIGVDLFPSVDFPIVTVSVLYEGSDPETIETDITEPIEEAVNTISGIKSLRSESVTGLSMVFVEFELGRNIDIAAQDVRDKVAAIRAELPLGIEPPIVEKFDPDSAPIMSITLAGPTSIRELTRVADSVIKPQLGGIDGVGAVTIIGGRDREIRIWLRNDDLHGYALTASDVVEAIEKENVEFPGGRVESGSRELVVRTKGRMSQPADFNSIVIAHRQGVPVYLRDVAIVEDGMEDFRSLSRLNGQRAVSLQIRRQSGENMLAVATEVKKRLDSIRADLPNEYQLTLTQDLSRFVKNSVDEAQGELVRGGLLAVLVILIFLRSWRGAFIAAVTIPTTIVTTYAFMNAFGFTLNMMSLLALSISVGMVIDDSIVVLENAFRHLEQGKSRIEAAIAGMREIGFAVLATSLAIVAVFVPVAFMDGLIGKFFFEFGLTVAFAVIVSTFVAVWLSPMLCSRLLSVVPQHGRLFNLVERFFTGIEGWYGLTLKFALRRRWLISALAIGVFMGSLLLLPFVGTEFVPPQDEGQFNVQIETPLGSSIERTSQILEEVEKRLWRLPTVDNIYTTIGAGQEGRVNYGAILVQLPDKSERSISQHDIMSMAREALADLSHSKISVEYIPRVSGGGFRSAPLQYNLRGSDIGLLEQTAVKVVEQLRTIPGIVDINLTYDSTKPEISVIPDRDRAADLGIDIEKIGRAVQTMVGGRPVSTFEDGSESFDVRVRLAEADRNRADAIGLLPVRTRDERIVEFRSVAEIIEGTGPVQIDRQNRQRQITIMANLEKTKPLGAAIADTVAIEAAIGLPPGVTSAFTGAGDMMAESFASMLFALVLAIILIYMVLASQFESFIHPVTIMLSVPLSIGGALGALALTGLTLNIFSMIGMVMLMGLVTKNAILLVDYTNLLRRERGLEKNAALLAAGPVRLRPILMTAFSTIAGMIPIAIGLGTGSETRQPMGACVIGGMITSTFLTLVVIPVVYSLLDDLGSLVRRWLTGDDRRSEIQDTSSGLSSASEIMHEIPALTSATNGGYVAVNQADHMTPDLEASKPS